MYAVMIQLIAVPAVPPSSTAPDAPVLKKRSAVPWPNVSATHCAVSLSRSCRKLLTTVSSAVSETAAVDPLMLFQALENQSDTAVQESATGSRSTSQAPRTMELLSMAMTALSSLFMAKRRSMYCASDTPPGDSQQSTMPPTAFLHSYGFPMNVVHVTLAVPSWPVHSESWPTNCATCNALAACTKSPLASAFGSVHSVPMQRIGPAQL